MTGQRPAARKPPTPNLPATWGGRAALGGGSALGLGGIAAVSPALAITLAIVAGVITITTMIVRELPAIIHARTIAKAAKKACTDTNAERALRILVAPEYLDKKAQPTDVLGRMIGEPPAASSRPGTPAETPGIPAEQNKAPEDGVVVPFTNASGKHTTDSTSSTGTHIPPEAPASGPSTLAG
jgi:hypothetical protein